MTKSYRYKGLIIYENDKGSCFNTLYYTVVNPKIKDTKGRLLHAHSATKNHIEKIVDCYHCLKNGYPAKFSLTVRNKAMTLLGDKIK